MKLTATKRQRLGKKVKTLRQQELLPAVVFGKELKESIPITLDKKEFERVYSEAGESTLIDVEITNDDGQRHKMPQLHKALISEIAVDPVSDKIIHANLLAVKLTEKTTATIPVEIVGESPIVKSGGGILLKLLDEVEVEALPLDLPPKIEVNISKLTAVDQGITVEDLPVDRTKVEIKQDPKELVVKVEHAEMKEEEVKAEEKPIEEAVEITTAKKKEEGEEGEEGKEKVRPKKAVAREKS